MFEIDNSVVDSNNPDISVVSHEFTHMVSFYKTVISKGFENNAVFAHQRWFEESLAVRRRLI